MRRPYLTVGAKPLILCYHAVSDTLESDLAVRTGELRAQLARLAALGYKGTTFAALERARAAGEDTSRLAAITFDDGYRSMLHARTILDEFDFKATVFALPSMLGSDEPMSWPGIEQYATGPQRGELVPLNWDEAEALKDGGWEIGAHTLTHPDLRKISDGQLADELGGSREQLIARLGNCDSVAYPYGYANSRVAGAARDAGFCHGATLEGFHIVDTPLRRPRIGIFVGDGSRRFDAKIAGWTRALRTLPGGFVASKGD